MSPPERFEAVLFDLDGTLVDNMRFHLQAWEATCAELGLAFSEERFERDFAGRTNAEIFAALLGRPLAPEELARRAAAKEARYRALYAPHLAPVQGTVAFLDALEQRGVLCAVASAAPAENRAFVLEGLRLQGRFRAVVGPEHVRRGKPAPDLFLEAARQLDVAPERTLVFEDAVNGVRAARSAGMAVAALPTTVVPAFLREAGAHWVMDDFTSLPDALRERLGVSG